MIRKTIVLSLLSITSFGCSVVDNSYEKKWRAQDGCFVSSAWVNYENTQNLILDTTGWRAIDIHIGEELEILSELTNINPSVRVFDDYISPNALALPYQIFDVPNQYTILFGANLASKYLRYENGRPSSAKVAFISGILMHEYAHLSQYLFNSNGSVKEHELMADMLAGWYIGYRYPDSVDAINDSADEFYSMGDFQFNDPDHHGTPQERNDAFWKGYFLYRSGVTDFWQAYNYSLGEFNLSSDLRLFGQL